MKSRSTFATRAFEFYTSLAFDVKLPRGVSAMNPYRDAKVKKYVRAFLEKFFSDNRKRVMVLGINPGRFGSGATGVTFTDPVALEKFCGIPNDLPQKREPSSVFIYDLIQQWGGPKKFYRDFFLTAVSPLGFVKDGKNYNFYDHPGLLRDIRPFLVRSIEEQIDLGGRRDAAIVLGTGKIKNVFENLNNERHFFKRVHYLEHPRFIMQYRYRRREEYLKKYYGIFARALKGK